MAEYSVKGNIGILKIVNPPVNALSVQTTNELLKCIRISAKNNTAALVLCGKGAQFSAGADVTEFTTSNEESLKTLIDVTHALEASAKPVVAALHGYAFGGGLELAMACHYRVVHAKTKLGLPEVKLGIIPAAGGTQRLPRLAGIDTAMKWIAFGQSYDAATAQKLGIVDLVVEGHENDVINTAVEYANSVLGKSLIARRTSLTPIKGVQDLDEITAKHLVAIHKKARGQISPLAGIRAVHIAATSDFSNGMKKEAEIFKTLVTSGQARGTIHSFLGERKVRKWSVPGTTISWKTAKPSKVKKGAVIGLGTMGRGITINFLRAGISVIVIEMDETSLKSGLKGVFDIIGTMVKRGVISQQNGDWMRRNVTPALDYSELGDVDLVIEAVFEEIEIKEEVFRKLDHVCKSSAIIASNTSALDIDKIAEFTQRPQRVMGMHFFAPADRMALLENVYGAETSPETIATCMDVGKRMKKVTVLVGNYHGFVANRMYLNYMTEADFLLEEGGYPTDIDKALTDYGFAMGRYLVADLSGNDVLYRVRRSSGLTAEQQPPWCSERERSGKRYCPLADLVYAKNRFGFKTGKGWHDYDQGLPVPSPEVMQIITEYRQRNFIAPRRIDDQEVVDRTLYPLINEGFKTLDEGYASNPVDIDMIWIHGYAWPKQTGGPMFYAHTVGLPKVLSVIKHYYSKFGDFVPHWKPSRMLVRLVEGYGNPPMEDWMKCSLSCTPPSNL